MGRHHRRRHDTDWAPFALMGLAALFSPQGTACGMTYTWKTQCRHRKASRRLATTGPDHINIADWPARVAAAEIRRQAGFGASVELQIKEGPITMQHRHDRQGSSSG